MLWFKWATKLFKCMSLPLHLVHSHLVLVDYHELAKFCRSSWWAEEQLWKEVTSVPKNGHTCGCVWAAELIHQAFISVLEQPVLTFWCAVCLTSRNRVRKRGFYRLCEGEMPGGHRFMLNMYTAASAVENRRQKQRNAQTTTADAARPSCIQKHTDTIWRWH